MVSEAAGEYSSQWAAIESIAAKIGCTPDTLRRWVRQQERDTGQRPGSSTIEEEPICKVMQVAPSGYWGCAAQQRNPALRCARVQRDDVLGVEIERVWQANLQVDGADKVWRQLR